MQNGSNGTQTESNMQNRKQWYTDGKQYAERKRGTQAESNTQKNNSTKRRTETSRTLHSHAAQTEQMEYSMMQAISSVMQVMQSEMWLMT